MSENKKALAPKLRFPEFSQAGEWNIKKLAQVAKLISEKAGSKKVTLMSVTAGIGLVSQVEKFGREIAGTQYKNYFVIQNNDFAYNKSATKDFPEGFVALYEGDMQAAVPNSIFTCFRVDENEVLPRFLNYQFLNNLHGRWLRKFITIGARAHGSLNIDNKDLLALPVPLPIGLSALTEQQKIADCLSSLDALIAAQAEKLDALKTHKKGLMQQLFPREGETVPRLRFPEFRDAGEWEEKSLSDCCRLQAGKFVRASEIYEKAVGERYPCYGGNGLRGYTKTFTHSGQYPLIGRQGAQCGNVNLANGKFHATEHAVVATANQEVDTIWLFYKLTKMNLNQYATGQAQPGLSVENLDKLIVSIPENEQEQKQIADCLSSLDDLIAAHTEKLDTLKTHKKGLMQQLFPTSEAISV